MSRHTRLVRPSEDLEADRIDPALVAPAPQRRAVVDVTGLTGLQVRDVELFIAMLRDGPVPEPLATGALFARPRASGSRYDEEIIEIRIGGADGEPGGEPFARLEPIAMGGRTLRDVMRRLVGIINSQQESSNGTSGR